MTPAADVALPTHAPSPGRLTVEIVSDLGALGSLRQDWDDLIARSPAPTGAFFMSHAWCLHVAETRLKAPSGSYRLCAAVVRQNGVAVAIWPLSVQKSAFSWIARNLDDPFGQFGGLVVDAAADPKACAAAVIEALRARRLADGLHIDCVCDGSPLHTALTGLGIEKHSSNTAPWINFQAHPDFASYIALRNSKTRKNLRNALNKLSRLGTIEFTTSSDRDAVRRIIGDSFSGRIDWLNQMGKSSTAFRNGDFGTLVGGLPDCSSIELLGFSLDLDGRSIASQWGFVYGTTYYAYISTRNQAYDDYSVGRLHLANVIESCHQRGLTSIELMPPDSEYKRHWSNDVRQLDVFTQHFTALGRFDIGIFEQHILPGAKSLGRRLPQSVRSRISALLNRPARTP
jgi:CelD/BcsL family acetyltransferase involved in cellulose biosynthesis